MTDSSPTTGGAKRALSYVLGATVVAGAVGYVIQAVVPGFLSVSDYATFGAFWAITYLVVSGLSGVQQELTRVSRKADDNGAGARNWRSWAGFTLATATVMTLLVGGVFWLLFPTVMPSSDPSLVGALAIAVLGYTLIAGLSAALYGIEFWPGVAGMTIADSVLRLITIGAALLLGFGVVALGWAIAVPFIVAALLMWIIVGQRVRSSLHLDSSLPQLVRGTITTVGASLATGVLISGLPFLLRASGSNEAVGLVASLMLVITLTRAPLVVPVMALQSYLIVTFRDRADSVRSVVLKYSAALLGVAVLLAGLAALVGPWLLDWLYGGQYSLSGWDFALIVVSAGLTGVMCITAPAVLALGKHRAYVAGWALAAIVTVVILFLPLGQWHARVLIALTIAPAVGALLHLGSLRSRATSHQQ